MNNNRERLFGATLAVGLTATVASLLLPLFFMMFARHTGQMIGDIVTLVGFAAGRLLLLALGYVACAAALAWLFTRLVEPVYTFPEWVPAVLVEPKDIQTAFWNVWQTSATVVEYRTPELLRLRFLREVMAWSCGACALLIGSLTGAASMLFKRPAPDGEQSSTECAERS